MIAPFLASFPRRVVVFNPTGRYATAQVAAMREAGTRLVGGIALGRGGESLDGLPLYDDLRALPEPADAAVIYTPPEGVLDAVRAAAGIPTIVVAAEYVPVHDSLLAARAARAAGSWLVGPNTLGLCIPGRRGEAGGLLGSIAPSFCSPGRVAVLCRSGTLTLTMARLLTAAGIGQRAVMHIGGDTICGRNPHEYLAARRRMPAPARCSIAARSAATRNTPWPRPFPGCPKPVVAMLVGRHAPAGTRMGHAGALVGGARELAAAKLAALAAAGARTARDPAAAIAILKELSL